MTRKLSKSLTVGGLTAALLAATFTVAPAITAVAVPTVEPSTVLPTSFPYQPELPEPAVNSSDQSIGRGALPYDKIAPMLNDWMDQSDIISSQVVTRSTQGRDIYLVTITAPETTAETAQQVKWRDEVKYDAAKAATDTALLAGYKRPVWFNGNIHGNEWEGTDITMGYIEWLLENEQTAQVQELISDYRLYFTVVNNPDGRVNATRATALGLDPNRDFVTNVTPETSVIRDLTAQIQPIFFSDYHGYTNVLQVEPTGPPHGENYDYDLFIPHAYAAALEIEQAVVDATIEGNTYMDKTTGAISTTKTANSGIKIPYRDTPSGWDDWPPIFTAQYVAFQGAISYTVELPLGRVNNNPTESARRTKVNTEVGLTAVTATMDYITENDEDILANQIEIFRRGAAGEPRKTIPENLNPADYPGPTQWIEEWGDTDALGHDEETSPKFPRAYMIPAGDGQQSDSDAAHLVDFLISHGVLVRKLTAPATIEGTLYPAGSYYVDMHQPLRGMANALLAAGSDISSWIPSMYDISAWSQGFLWGATTTAVGETTDTDFPVSSVPVVVADPTGSLPAEASGYLKFTLDGVDDFRGLNALLSDGISASLVGTNTVVFGGAKATPAKIDSLIDTYGLAVEQADGTELSGSEVKPLEKLTIGFVGSTDDRLSLYELGFAPEQLVTLSAAGIQSDPAILDDIDVLWVGSALTINSGTQPAAYAALQDYVDSGRGAVAKGTAGATFATTWYDAGITTISGNGSGNGIVKLETAATGLLAELGTEYGFVYPAYSFAVAAGTSGVVEQTYASENPLISGHWRSTTGTNGPETAAGRASVVSSTVSSGAKALVFGTSVTFRVHPRGHFSEVATGLYWAATAATSGVLAAPAATTTTLSLGTNSAAYGDAVSATVKVAGSSSSRAGSVKILSGSNVIATAAVNSFGNATFKLPSTIAVGDYALTAKYSPAAGAALVGSESAAADLTITPAISTVALSLSSGSFQSGTKSPITATATIGYSTGSAPVAGVVKLVSGATVIASAPAGSTVTIPVPASLAAGSYSLVAQYVPASESVTGSSSAAVPLGVTAAPGTPKPPVTTAKAKTTTKVKLAKKKLKRGKKVKVKVTLTAPAGKAISGKVRITLNGKVIKTVSVAKKVTTVTIKVGKKVKKGTAKVRANYLGTTTLKASKSKVAKLKLS
ncbi:hypothetical protein GCM10010401_14580 [Rarobacter faecitabidus]|uniref:Ig-like domain-containing protein n=1 Tax=Rarobacter faecitabidus TaxID=13243 RepID=A0A542ZDR7_RARFA|nr:M14 family metallopeptidase [Rarobacter faecitabidus]TQL58495.1 Ig-like domain-containing protein [Rarobacter faecitabidus]